MTRRKTPYNIGFAKWRLKCFYETFVQGASSVFQLNICAEIPPLRKAENRYERLQRSRKISHRGFQLSKYIYYICSQNKDFV